jgi:hypothetical protein
VLFHAREDLDKIYGACRDLYSKSSDLLLMASYYEKYNDDHYLFNNVNE